MKQRKRMQQLFWVPGEGEMQGYNGRFVYYLLLGGLVGMGVLMVLLLLLQQFVGMVVSGVAGVLLGVAIYGRNQAVMEAYQAKLSNDELVKQFDEYQRLLSEREHEVVALQKMIQEIQPPQALVEADAQTFPDMVGDNQRILVIDDDPNLQDAVQMVLEYNGYTVYAARDGQEGLTIFEKEQPDLVFLDIMMPDIDGWEVCRRLRLISDVPIIILTVLSKDDMVVRGLDYGADDFITKPFSTQVLLARTRATLRRRELEQQVRESSALLSKLNQELETMLYTVSHDLKEPLRAIQNFSLLVSQRYAHQLDEKGQDYLQRVDRAAKRLQQLIDDILTLSRAQRMETPSEWVSSAEIVQDVLTQLQPRIQETVASVFVHPDLPMIHVNRTWATHAIYNLVSNALKYVEAEDVPDIEIIPYTGEVGSGLVVQDRGTGVPEEQHERIFQLFRRAVGRELEGTGAGLAIVRQVAEKHNGLTWVEPREGGGSRFIITFGQETL